MNTKELKRDLNYIQNNAGNISVKKLLTLYEKYLNGADKYALGTELDNQFFIIFRKHIPLKYCTCQTTHKTTHNIQYLRFRPHKKGAKEIVKARGAILLGESKDILKLYHCNNKSGTNKGYCCEKAVFNHFNIDGWVQDNKRADKGGDVEICGEQVQVKFGGADGTAATITSTDKIIRKINELLKESV